MTMREYDGTRMLRTRDSALLRAFPAAVMAGSGANNAATNAATKAATNANGTKGIPSDHIYLIDPLGNLVLRFPKNEEPARMKKDLDRLLKYSRIG